jgi:cytoskeletal protein CcmA (bactofilin family)
MVDGGSRDRLSTPEERLAMLREMKKGGGESANARAPAPTGKASVLGRTLTFKGELIAQEDLVVQGRIEGSVRHTQSLTIGVDGSVVGDIHARVIVVEGSVEGDLHGKESVAVRSTGRVRGSIYTPSVALADGAAFNGRIEMEIEGEGAKRSTASKDAKPAVQAAAPRQEPPENAEASRLDDDEVDALLRS